MSYTRTIFSQLLQYLPRLEFQNIVNRYEGDKNVRKLHTWDQLVGMLFGQLTGHNSLRAISAGLKAMRGKLYHLGIAHEIKRSTLSDANDKRDFRIYQEAYQGLLPRVQQLAPKKKFKFKSPVKAVDATTIELCLALSPWAQFRKQKGGIKLHMAIDIAGDLPDVMVLTDGKKSDIRVGRGMKFSAGSVLLMDRGYVDSQWLWKLTEQGVYFVTRLKRGMKFKVRESRPKNRTQGILADQIIKLTGPKGKGYEGKIRRVKYQDEATGKTYEYLTNRFDLSAKTIADLYKARWQVELFFKTMKQRLQVKKFVGTSINAVMIQVWVALIAYLLLMLVKYRSKLGWSLPALMAALTVALFENRLLESLWKNVPKKRSMYIDPNQLRLPGF